MTIALAKDVEGFLEEQVRAGISANPSELSGLFHTHNPFI
jgi:hypothetical protein